MNNQADVIRAQYKTDGNLNARITIHTRYSTNTYGWSNWVFDRFSFSDTARILELGCGPGGLWAGNRHRLIGGWRILLTDLSPGMIAAARRNLAPGDGTFHFSVLSAQQIPHAEAAFDAVIANHMLYHVPDRRRALQEIHRVLKPGGVLYATTVGEGHMQEMWDLLSPFVPEQIDARVSTVARGFTLQNGGAQLAAVFDRVKVEAYPDDLEVTEVEPVIAYLASSQTHVLDALTPEQLATVRAAVAERIATNGSFHIHKSSGIFIAGK